MTAVAPTAYADDDLPEIVPTRPAWLMTLADLALLLVGFFVFLQASQHLERAALARGLREGFGVREAPAAIPPAVHPAVAALDPMAVSAGAMAEYAVGSATLPHAPDALIAWVRDATRDPRVTVRIAGVVDGSPRDVDLLTASGPVLAADRARAVATALVLAHAVPADRITIISAVRPGQRTVIVTTGFAPPMSGVRP